MDISICLHFIKLFFIIDGFHALSFLKFDIETIKVNRTRNVTLPMEKKFDDYHALKGEHICTVATNIIFAKKTTKQLCFFHVVRLINRVQGNLPIR